MKYIKEAIKIAIKGRNKEDKHYHLGAVVVRGDSSIAYAHNGMTRTPEPSAHAEARALRKAGYGATLYVARVMADNTWGLAAPCKFCQRLCKQYRVKKVYFTIGDGTFGVWIP